MKAYFPPVRSLALLLIAAGVPAACSVIIDNELQDKPLSSTSSSSGIGGSDTGGSGGTGAGGTSVGGGGSGGSGGGDACNGTCSASETCCTDTCFSLQTDVNHCGDCNVACSANEKCCGGSCAACCESSDCPTQDHQCISGACVLMCSSPAMDCGSVCADIANDPKNCGACGTDCLSGHACVGKTCQSGWASMTTTGALSPRQRAAACWTGSQVFIWGGQNPQGVLGDGALYDPKTDTWTMLPDTGAPTARVDAVAVKMNNQVFVWGGGLDTNMSGLNNGKIFDLATSTWLPMLDAPLGRRNPVAFWTGTKIVLWGGASGGAYLAGGALYEPTMNKWSVMTNSNAPSSRSGVGAAWSGVELLLFGGRPGGSGATNEGYAYDPVNNLWRKLASTGAPGARFDPFAAWTGSSLLIYGGRDAANMNSFSDAALYTPGTDSWKSGTTNTFGKRSAPTQQTGWVSSGMPKILVAGGLDEALALKVDGRVYDAGVNDWGAQIPAWPSGSDHQFGVAVWTGVELILWSGLDNGMLNSAGDRYRP